MHESRLTGGVFHEDDLVSSFTDKDRFDYYWKHFALIADQRVKTFNLYIIVVGATLVATVIAEAQHAQAVALPDRLWSHVLRRRLLDD